MTKKQLEKLKEGDKVTSPFEDEAEVRAIDENYGSVTLHVENPMVDPEATATLRVSFDGLLSDWEFASAK